MSYGILNPKYSRFLGLGRVLDHVQPERIPNCVSFLELRTGKPHGSILQATRHQLDLDPSNLLACTVALKEIEARVAIRGALQSGFERDNQADCLILDLHSRCPIESIGIAFLVVGVCA